VAACCDPVRFGPDYVEDRRLADGTAVRLRLLRPDDREKLLTAFEQLSAESRYTRFFTAMPRLPDATLTRLLDTDGVNRLAIVAESDDRSTGYGIARFIRLDDAPDTAEAAVVVVDEMQRRGLGKLLLARLAAAARERGITHFRAEVLRTNQAMMALVHDVDHAARASFDGPVAVYDLSLPAHGETEAQHGALFHMLRVAAAGVQVVLRRLLPDPNDA
jgi:GNAT superfamily N-acetyltransferase